MTNKPVFDPDQVVRLGAKTSTGAEMPEFFVFSTDYDRLLEMYRELKSEEGDDPSKFWAAGCEISTRSFNVLYYASISKEDFLRSTPLSLRKKRNCGVKSVIELAAIAKYQLNSPLKYGKAIWDASAKQKSQLQELCAVDG